MHYLSRLIAIIIGSAAWTALATTAASAAMLHDPVPAGSVAITGSTGAPMWAYVVTAAVGFLLALAVVAEVSFAVATLVTSLRTSRKSGHPLNA